MRTVAIIQARMGSTRLPGKVLKQLANRSVLGHVIHRTKTCPDIDTVMVATTIRPEDDPVAAEAARHEAEVYRGNEQDVLDRYYKAAHAARAEVVVRLTADCPLLDPGLMSKMIRRFTESGRPRFDYLSNTLERTYPRGLDVEVFTWAALEQAWREAKEPYQREHVTPYLYQHPDLFKLHNYKGRTDLSGERWTLDTPEDWNFMEAVFRFLAPDDYRSEAVLAVLSEHPELRHLNAHVEQKPLTDPNED